MTSIEPLAPAVARMDTVAARMRALSAALPERDGVAVFNRVYLSVTEELARRITAGGFHDPYRTAELGARFARRYLLAVEADAGGRRPPACWRPLFRARHRAGIHPLRFALAGINAHVGHDLALAVVDACDTLRVEPADIEPDFERVGEVLDAVEERVRERLMPGPDLLELADPLTHLAGTWTLSQARRTAWHAARLLWTLRPLPHLQRAFAARLDAWVGCVGRRVLAG
jgi:hypothetical protein